MPITYPHFQGDTLYYPIPPEGEWDLVFVWFHLPYYYPIPPEGEWDFVFVWLLDVGLISIFQISIFF